MSEVLFGPVLRTGKSQNASVHIKIVSMSSWNKLTSYQELILIDFWRKERCCWNCSIIFFIWYILERIWKKTLFIHSWKTQLGLRFKGLTLERGHSPHQSWSKKAATRSPRSNAKARKKHEKMKGRKQELYKSSWNCSILEISCKSCPR